MRKRALSFITLLAILLSLGSINAFASPVMSGDIIVVDDNAGAIITIDELENGIVTVTASLKGIINIMSFQFVVGYDATTVAPYDRTTGNVLGNETLNGADQIAPYMELLTDEISGWNFSSYKIDNANATRKFFNIGYYNTVQNDYLILERDEVLPIYRVYFKIIDGAAIDADTFYYTPTPGIPTHSKLTRDSLNIGQAGTTGIVRPEAFTKEVNLLSRKELTGISIISLPNKVVYNVGETLDTAGLFVEAQYSDDTTAIVTNFVCSPTALSNDGIDKIQVSCTEGGVTKTAAFDVVVRQIPANITESGNIRAELSDTAGAAVENGTIQSSIPGFELGSDNAFAFGTDMTLTAKPVVDGMKFLYWKNASSNRIVSTKEEYTFKIGSDTQLTAVYRKNEAGKYLVEFYDKNGKVLQSGYLTASDKITKPADPYAVGYEFKDWSPDVPEYPGRDYAFIAQYEVENNTYPLTLIGPSMIMEGGGTNKYNTKVTVEVNTKAIPEGQRFLCWKRDGRVVGYENEYSFYVWDETTVTAVFASETEEPAKAPHIMMDKVKVYTDPARLAFMSERIVPEGYECIETGILLKSGSADESTLKLDGEFDTKAVSQSTAATGQFTVRKDDVSGAWYARAYVIYKDGANIKVIYSNIVSWSD